MMTKTLEATVAVIPHPIPIQTQTVIKKQSQRKRLKISRLKIRKSLQAVDLHLMIQILAAAPTVTQMMLTKK